MGGTLDLDRLNINVQNLQPSDCTDGAVCNLPPVDISGQPDPCNTIDVAVRFDNSGECQEGAVSADQLAAVIGQCLGIGSIDTDIQSFTGIATGSDTATLNVTEDGNSLDVFLRGDNITFSGSGTAASPLRMSVADVEDTEIQSGDGISVTGSGTQADPFVIRFVACGLQVITSQDVESAASVLVAACVDGETVLMPLPEIVIGEPDLCSLTVLNQNQVQAAASVLVAACVDGSPALIPETIDDPNDDEIDFASGPGIDILVDTTANGTQYTVNLDLCELPTVLRAVVESEPNSFFAMCVDGENVKVPLDDIDTLFTANLQSGTNITITGTGSDLDPYVISSSRTFVSAGNGITLTGNGDQGNPYVVSAVPRDLCSLPLIPPATVENAASVRYAGCVDGTEGLFDVPEVCTNVFIRDLDQTIPGQSFSRTDFLWNEVNPQTALSTQSLSFSVSSSNNSVVVLQESANRFRLAPSGTNPSTTITMGIGANVCNLSMVFRDVDFPVEFMGGWNITPDSINPPFGNTVDSTITWNNINSSIISFSYGGPAFETVAYVESLTTCPIEGPCFQALRCVAPNGAVRYRDINTNAILSGNYIEC